MRAQLAVHVRRYAEPWLHRLSADHGELLAAARHSPAYSQAIGACRVAVLLARHHGRDQATAFLRERMEALGTRTDVAAEREREMAALLRGWLAAR